MSKLGAKEMRLSDKICSIHGIHFYRDELVAEAQDLESQLAKWKAVADRLAEVFNSPFKNELDQVQQAELALTEYQKLKDEV